MRSTINHISSYFVANNPRELVSSTACTGTPAIPVPHQGESQTAGPYPDQDLSGTWLRQRDFLQQKRASWLLKYQSLHARISLVHQIAGKLVLCHVESVG